jgi:micrococcal nuclease
MIWTHWTVRSLSRLSSRRRIRSRTVALRLVLVAGLSTVAFGACAGDLATRLGKDPERGGEDRVARVVDGDTVVLEGLGRIRVIGVDAPEVGRIGDCYGPEAAAFTRRALPRGTRVAYEFGIEERDRYGRALVHLRDGRGRLVSLRLAASGHARPLLLQPNLAYSEEIQAAAERARRRRLGLWRYCRGADGLSPARSAAGRRECDGRPG